MLRTISLFLALLVTLPASAIAAPQQTVPFGVAAHSNVNIEWWYVNAHVTTERGHHLALIGSFFRFGNGKSPLDGATPAPRAHYLIYAVTDLDAKTQRAYSLADTSMVAYLKQVAPFLAIQNPHDLGAQALLASLNAGHLPAPHQELSGTPTITNSPFRLAYGIDNTLTADNPANTDFTLSLGSEGSRDKIHMTLSAQKPAMAVGGNGETGLKKKNDMYYFSLTRCAVGGTVDTGNGPDKITGGNGWFDHQWGNSWVASNNGWDWWGIQLDDGTDILCFRQRDLTTGRIFFPLATFMDKTGHQTVTRNIRFTPVTHSLWKSARTGVTYPLSWQLTFPDQGLTLKIAPSVQNQEMPILGPGSGIWEGSCLVHARPTKSVSKSAIGGTAYMELVGYSSPAVKKLQHK